MKWSDSEDYDFSVWAFGQELSEEFGVSNMPAMKMLDAWNKLHGKMQKFKSNGSLREDLVKMKELYKEYGQKDSQDHK